LAHVHPVQDCLCFCCCPCRAAWTAAAIPSTCKSPPPQPSSCTSRRSQGFSGSTLGLNPHRAAMLTSVMTTAAAVGR
jgi:hypothetical protein